MKILYQTLLDVFIECRGCRRRFEHSYQIPLVRCICGRWRALETLLSGCKARPPENRS